MLLVVLGLYTALQYFSVKGSVGHWKWFAWFPALLVIAFWCSVIAGELERSDSWHIWLLYAAPIYLCLFLLIRRLLTKNCQEYGT